MAADCLFCKIRDGEIPSTTVYRDDVCFVIKDIAPKAPTHLLAIPNEHFTFLRDLTPQRHAMIGAMFGAAHKVAVEQGIDRSGYRLIVNQGEHAGQMVDHLHLHILGGHPLGEMG